MAVVIPRSRPLTVDDVRSFPADGNRYELIQGSLHVNPSPRARHQFTLVNVLTLLMATKSPGTVVVPAPFDVILGPDTLVQPDVVVARAADVQDWLYAAPLLAVEVLSPTTRHYDRGTKRLAYEEAGV